MWAGTWLGIRVRDRDGAKVRDRVGVDCGVKSDSPGIAVARYIAQKVDRRAPRTTAMPPRISALCTLDAGDTRAEDEARAIWVVDGYSTPPEEGCAADEARTLVATGSPRLLVIFPCARPTAAVSVWGAPSEDIIA